MIRQWWWMFYNRVQMWTGRGWKWSIVTWVGHGALTATGTLVYPMLGYGIASWYTGREAEQWLDGTTAPWYDRIGDVLFPWLVWIWLR